MTKVTIPKKNQTGANLWSSVEANDVVLEEGINGNLDTENLKAAAGITAGQLASSAKPFTWYTPKEVVTEQARTNVAFGTLTTADEIAGIIIPENALLCVSYVAEWKGTANPNAALFLGANQLKVFDGSGTNVVQAARGAQTAGKWGRLATGEAGLLGTGDSTDVAAEATTGQILATMSDTSTSRVYRSNTGGTSGYMPELSNYGGVTYVSAAAGTYALSVQFKAETGSVTAKNRKLRAWVIGV